MYIDINAISWCFDLNIILQDECLYSELSLEVECTKSILKTYKISDFGDLPLVSFC